ncbi:HNH endonuclease [bacterium]|nr:MAG: HNH endonuclease [bacterium]
MVTVKELNATTRPKMIKQLQKIWIKNGFEQPMPDAKLMPRELLKRLGLKQTPGRKIALCVIAYDKGVELEPHSSRKQKQQKIIPTKDRKKELYGSWEWRTLRIKVLNEFGARCMCCGATPEHKDMNGRPVKIVVDHIKSLHKHWELRLKRDNLQVLCEECNMGKGAWDETDHRPKRGPDEWIIEDDVPQAILEQLKYTH